MKFLKGIEEKTAIEYMNKTVEVAKNSNCLRSRCGSIIVKDGLIIGRGYNSPPKNKILKRCLKDGLPNDFISDKTCCVHAEDRAIKDALKLNPDKIKDSRLYFIRLNLENKILKAGKPYCTWCSKSALDAEIAEFVLWHEEGVCVYTTEEYNRLSYQFK